MNLNYIYYYFTAALSDDFINRCKELARATKEHKGLIGGAEVMKKAGRKPTTKDLTHFKKMRDSNITWLDQEWIYDTIHPYVQKANKEAGWGFYWDLGEAIQFTEYGKGQHYEWHQDRWETPINRPNTLFHNTNRVLSMTVNLTDPKEYEGGHLEFATIFGGKLKKLRCTQILPRGSVCVFPSDIWHRVTPVTRGKRISLVKWLSKKY